MLDCMMVASLLVLIGAMIGVIVWSDQVTQEGSGPV
ncbi:signal peptide protein [Paenibacillus ferrarius]